MPPILPSLTIEDIQRWVGEASLEKGRAYFRKGNLLQPRRTGQKLLAQCLGSAAAPYRLEVKLSSNGIATAACSCPVGYGGRCKHSAALLLAWLDNPEAFQEVEEMEKTLKRRSKTELVALVLRMLACDPDLETLLEFPTPQAEGGSTPLDPHLLAKQARHAFRAVGDELGDPGRIARELDPLLKLAGQARLAEDPQGAALVFRLLAETIMEHEEVILNDPDGRLGRVLEACVEGLGECLKVMQEPAQREAALHRLLDIACWDAQMGGLGGFAQDDSVPGILKAQAAPEERELISGWARAALPKMGEWGRKVLGRLLEELAQD